MHWEDYGLWLWHFLNIAITTEQSETVIEESDAGSNEIQCQKTKRTLGHVRPSKIQISLHIRAVWLNSLLGAIWIAEDAKFLHADNEDSDQTARMYRLIWDFDGRTCQKVRFLTLQIKYLYVKLS